MYLGCRELRGPRWESWIPATYFNCVGDHRFLAQQRDDAQSIQLDLVVDVYHPNDIHLQEDSRPQQPFPTEDCVFFVAHGHQTPPSPCSTSAITYMCNIPDREWSGEFLRYFDFHLISLRALALYIREFVRELEATCRGIPLETIGTLDRAAVTLNCLAARDVTKAAGDIAKAARDAAKTARDVAKAANDVVGAANDVADTANDIADVADDVAAYAATFAAERRRDIVRMKRASRMFHRILGHRNLGTQCSDIFAYKEVFRIPHYLVAPLLADADLRSHLHHRSGGSRVVLGGHTHPFDKDKWVPICVLDFQRLPASKH